MARKILIMGLPCAGKTTLALALLHRMNAVHFNADSVRQEISRMEAGGYAYVLSQHSPVEQAGS